MEEGERERDRERERGGERREDREEREGRGRERELIEREFIKINQCRPIQYFVNINKLYIILLCTKCMTYYNGNIFFFIPVLSRHLGSPV